MNAKKAKALRKLIKNIVAQSKEDIPERQYAEITKRAKYVIVPDDEAGSQEAIPTATTEDAPITKSEVDVTDAKPKVKRVKVATGQIINNANTQRALYLHMKRELVKTEKNHGR